MPRLLLTRPAEQAGPWLDALRAAGLPVDSLPLLVVGPLADPAPLQAAWGRLGEWRLLVFVSPNAVTHFWAARPAGAPWPAGTLAAAPGPGTAEALRRAGVPAGQVREPAADAARFDTESLWDGLRHEPGGWAGARVLILRGLEDAAADPGLDTAPLGPGAPAPMPGAAGVDASPGAAPTAGPPSTPTAALPGAAAGVGREWLSQTLLAAGSRVEALACYRRGPPALDAALAARLAGLCAGPDAPVWLLSSADAVGHLLGLLAALPDPARRPVWGHHTALCTHPRIAERARAAGFGSVHTLPPQPAAVLAWWQAQAPGPATPPR